MKSVITGATGLIGMRLAQGLDQPTILSRNPERAQRLMPGAQAVGWAPEREAAPVSALEGRDVVFHLAGEPVASGRWSDEKKRRIRDSRVIGTQRLLEGLAACEHPPKTLVAASAVGFYGDRGDTVLDESSSMGEGYLAEVCRDWETEALRAESLGIRVVCLRIGIVLAEDGGALEQMLPIFRLGGGGKLGSGQQWMPWIHVDDVVGLLLWSATNPEASGVYNGVAPEPVRNAEFTKSLAAAINRPAFMPVPRLGLRLLFGEKTSIIMASQNIQPRRALGDGYRFAFPQLDGALNTLFGAA
ncbi:MAG: TIGR01777 family oxidoreductase [Myxococcota bacterium]|nr:TIGR01777 family oxidoreductase [Myxococcota bacterium]